MPTDETVQEIYEIPEAVISTESETVDAEIESQPLSEETVTEPEKETKPEPQYVTKDEVEAARIQYQQALAQQEAERARQAQAQQHQQKLSEFDQKLNAYRKSELAKIKALAAAGDLDQVQEAYANLAETVAQARIMSNLPNLIEEAVAAKVAPMMKLTQREESRKEFLSSPNLAHLHPFVDIALSMEERGMDRNEIVAALSAVQQTPTIQPRRATTQQMESAGSGAPPKQKAKWDDKQVASWAQKWARG